MASGVKVSDEVLDVFNHMRNRKVYESEEEKRRMKKAVLLRLSDDKQSIILDAGKEILLGDVGTTVHDPYQHFTDMLPADDCRFALYDVSYAIEDRKEELVLIFWAPDGAPLRSKMIYAITVDTLRKTFVGLKHKWEVGCFEELRDRGILAEIIGAEVGAEVRAIEGWTLYQ